MSAPEPPDLRASDAERERAVAQLRAHCAAGRLTPAELEDQVGAAFAARTVAALRALLADLPPLPAPPARPGHDAAREAARRRVLHRAGVWAIVVATAAAVWLITGTDGRAWPAWVLLAAAVRVAVLAWSELGPGAEARRRLGRGSAAAPPAPPPHGGHEPARRRRPRR